MTNYTDIMMTRTDSNDDTIALRELPTDDRTCLRLLLELQRDAAADLHAAATRDLDPDYAYSIDAPRALTQFDYSGDHEDYNTAAAELLLHTTYALCTHEHETARDTIIALFNDDDFTSAASTANFDSPLLAYFLDAFDLDD